MRAPYNSTENYTRELARNGIAGLSFEFTGSRNKSKGAFPDSSLLTQAAELGIIMDVVASLPEIDSSNLFLWGHSFGGIISAYVAAQRPDDVKALVLLEPSLYMPDQYREMYPEGSQIPDSPVPDYPDIGRRFVEDIISVDIYEMIAGFDKEVLMFKGTACPKGQEEAYA